ncbi:MAG: transketolase [Bacteroidales bacterium]|jgi:transketolase|nr:transketolase [Bacteroidales bacterium]NLM93263.1 transketolase [Bacteroidales bacterium]
MTDIERLKATATQVRRDVLRMVHAVKSGHPGAPLGCAEFFSAMYFSVLRHSPKFDPEGKNQDLFFLSNGHLSAGWYSVLARSGYFEIAELNTFRKINSRLQGHPATDEGLPGIRVASGSLGQGLSVANGAALAKKLNHDKHLVYCLLGDGELQEGQVWEAAMFAAGRNIDNLIAVVDYNGQQIDGPVDEVMPLGNLKGKWEAFGWLVMEMDGNVVEEVLATMKESQRQCGKGKPVVVLMKTIMGKGVDFMEGSHKWHGSPPNDEQLEIALALLEETLGDY